MVALLISNAPQLKLVAIEIVSIHVRTISHVAQQRYVQLRATGLLVNVLQVLKAIRTEHVTRVRMISNNVEQILLRNIKFSFIINYKHDSNTTKKLQSRKENVNMMLIVLITRHAWRIIA